MEPKQLLEQIRARVGEASDEVTFAKYLEMVAEDPRLARLSHALISDMIEADGISVGPDGEERFDLFEGELFGQEHVIQQVADYFRAAEILKPLGPDRRLAFAAERSGDYVLACRTLEQLAVADPDPAIRAALQRVYRRLVLHDLEPGSQKLAGETIHRFGN